MNTVLFQLINFRLIFANEGDLMYLCTYHKRAVNKSFVFF